MSLTSCDECRSILRRGSRFNTSDLSNYQSKYTARKRQQMNAEVDELSPPRGGGRSTDVASRAALLVSIPLARCDDTDIRTSPVQRQRTHQSQTAAAAGPACSEQVCHETNDDVDQRRPSVLFNDDLQLSPNTDESRQVQRCKNTFPTISFLALYLRF